MTAEQRSPQVRRELLIGLVWVTAIAVIWSAFHLSGRLAAQYTLTPFDLTTLRVCVAGTIFLPWLLRNGLGGMRFWQALLLALSAGPGFSVFAFGGYLFAPAAHGATILAGTLPLFTAPLAWWLVGERVNPIRAASITVIFAGAMLLLLDATGVGQANQWIGDLSFFVGAASWSLFGVLARKWQVTPLRSAAIVATFTFVIFTPVHLLFLPSGLFDAPWQEIGAQWVFQGVIVFFGSTFGYTRAVAALGATPTATVVAVVPAAVALLAWLVLDEPLSLIATIGVVLVVIGMMTSGLRGPRKAMAAD
ncbi:MAG: EamA family transporter [Alphaproteobacteria bacterium]|nr:EamA family transporter [Alphaproteobacteria bacterium]